VNGSRLQVMVILAAMVSIWIAMTAGTTDETAIGVIIPLSLMRGVMRDLSLLHIHLASEAVSMPMPMSAVDSRGHGTSGNILNLYPLPRKNPVQSVVKF